MTLNEIDKSVLRSIIGQDTGRGVPNFNILPYATGRGKEISRSLQKLKRLGYIEKVPYERDTAWWKPIRENLSDGLFTICSSCRHFKNDNCNWHGNNVKGSDKGCRDFWGSSNEK